MSQAGLAVVFHQGGTTGARAPVVAACGRRSSLRRLGAPANARGRPPRLALARYWAASFGPGARWRLHCAGGLGPGRPARSSPAWPRAYAHRLSHLPDRPPLGLQQQNHGQTSTLSAQGLWPGGYEPPRSARWPPVASRPPPPPLYLRSGGPRASPPARLPLDRSTANRDVVKNFPGGEGDREGTAKEGSSQGAASPPPPGSDLLSYVNSAAHRTTGRPPETHPRGALP